MEFLQIGVERSIGSSMCRHLRNYNNEFGGFGQTEDASGPPPA